MLSTNKNLFRVLTALISLSVLFFACTSDKPLRPEVKAFREQMIADFNLLKSELIPALENDKPDMAAGKVIEKFLMELKSNDRRIFGISLLDTSGEYLTGFVIENKTTGKLTKDKYKDMNFHSFKIVEQIVKSRKILQEQLYLQDAIILAIGFPVIKEGDLLGIVCFSFKSHEFKKKWGISEKEFLQIDFGKV
jgi:hypothetical protein